VDIDQDDKVAFIESKHGLIGFGIVVRLLMKIYRNGYYMMWTEREQYLFSKGVSVDITSTKTIVNDCINEGIFNDEIYEKYGVLTSHGIQKRYLKGCERRKKVIMFQEYFLVDPSQDDVKCDNVALISVNVNMNPADSSITLTKTPQSKVKNSKVKDNILNNIIAREENAPVDNVDNLINRSESADNLYPSGNAGTETPVRTGENDRDVELSARADSEFMAFWSKYPKRSKITWAYEAWENVIKDELAKPPDLAMAAGKYALHVKGTRLEEKFIKMPSNFLKDLTFLDYLPVQITHCPTCREYPRCRGQGWFEVQEEDGPRVRPCPQGKGVKSTCD
jgi:hypothetical protein